MSGRWLLIATVAPILGGCLDDLEPEPPETLCTFSRTKFQRQVIDRLGVDDAEVGSRRCREPEEYVISSPFAQIPDAVIEPSVNIIRVEVFRGVRSDIDETAYPCESGGEDTGELVLCGGLEGLPPAGSTIVSFETDEPLPFADPTDHIEIGFGFDSDNLIRNNTTPENSPDDFHLRVDRWLEITYEPGRGWALEAFANTDGGIISLATSARLVIDGPVVALVASLAEFAVDDPKFRLYLLRHPGDFGAAPPHDWTGFVFPSLSEPLF